MVRIVSAWPVTRFGFFWSFASNTTSSVFTPGKFALIVDTPRLYSATGQSRLLPSTGLPILICRNV